MAKQVTREQAERKRQQAVSLMDRIGDTDRANEFADMSVEEYADHRGLQIVANPDRKETKRNDMATGTKAELQEQIDDAIGTLNDAYTPEATREELARAVGEALDILNAEDEEESDEEDSDLDDEEDIDEGE